MNDPDQERRPNLPAVGRPLDNPSGPGGAPMIISVMCFSLVAVSSPINLVLGLWCWGMLDAIFGSGFADNSGATLYLLLAIVQVGLFAAIWLPVFFLSRRRSTTLRCGLVIGATALYLGTWLGWTAMIYAEMARTGNWL